MKSTEDIEKLVKNLDLDVDTKAEADRTVLNELLDAQKGIRKTRTAYAGPNTGRTIMKSPIMKLAAAAIIVAVLVMGMLDLLGTDSGSGVVWADVAQRVQASRGIVYRGRVTNSKHGTTTESGHSIIQMSTTHYRSDGYKKGQCWISMYDDREVGKRVVLLHGQKGYVLEDITVTEEGDQRHADFMDPRKWIGKFLACKYDALERKNVDGILCEGIETTDTALIDGEPNFQIDSFVARLWVAVETGLPVLLEARFEGEHSGESIMDQFQWNAKLDAAIFEPDIPPDYEQL